MYSQSVINDLQYYDIICIGNYAAIVADYINSIHHQEYKIAVLHLSKTVKLSSPSTIGSDTVVVSHKPRTTDIIRKQVSQILPQQKIVILNDGHRIVYKFLIHGEDNWTDSLKDHPLTEALQNKYSRVYSNLAKGNQFIQSEGNIVFYIPKGPNNFQQNYPFLLVADQLRLTNSQLIILLEGQSFYPQCSEANQLLVKQLQAQAVIVAYNAQINKVDFLRRVLFYAADEGDTQIPYEAVYCFVGEQTPKLLSQSRIEPRQCHPHLLHNLSHDNIYVIGADLLPTTFSLNSLGMQIHHIVHNIMARLTCQEQGATAMLASYNGSTAFTLKLGQKDQVKISHEYEGSNFRMENVGCCWSRMHEKIQGFFVRQFLNYDNFGPPHYLWVPSLTGTEKWKDSGQHFNQKEELLKLTQLNFKASKG